MLWDENCRTAGLGKTECPVGWEGNGGTIMLALVRHCYRGNEQITDRGWLPLQNHSFTLAIDHKTGQVLAYVLADHKDQALVELRALLEPFGVQKFYTDGWGAYARLLDEDQHVVGKQNTQKIERKQL